MTSGKADWARYVDLRLLEAGLQRSEPRRRVIEFLAAHDCAVTALEIDAELEGIGRATVYRAIEQLEKLDLIRRVDLGGSALGYEKLDPSGEHHHHLVCRRCGRVEAFEDEVLESAVDAIDRHGFTIETHEVTLYGLCQDCRQTEP